MFCQIINSLWARRHHWERGRPARRRLILTPPRLFFSRVVVRHANAGGTPALPVNAYSFSGDCIEEQRIGCQRLPTILWPKAEEDDAAFAHADFDQRGFAFDAISAE